MRTCRSLRRFAASAFNIHDADRKSIGGVSGEGRNEEEGRSTNGELSVHVSGQASVTCRRCVEFWFDALGWEDWGRGCTPSLGSVLRAKTHREPGKAKPFPLLRTWTLSYTEVCWKAAKVHVLDAHVAPHVVPKLI